MSDAKVTTSSTQHLFAPLVSSTANITHAIAASTTTSPNSSNIPLLQLLIAQLNKYINSHVASSNTLVYEQNGIAQELLKKLPIIDSKSFNAGEIINNVRKSLLDNRLIAQKYNHPIKDSNKDELESILLVFINKFTSHTYQLIPSEHYRNIVLKNGNNRPLINRGGPPIEEDIKRCRSYCVNGHELSDKAYTEEELKNILPTYGVDNMYLRFVLSCCNQRLNVLFTALKANFIQQLRNSRISLSIWVGKDIEINLLQEHDVYESNKEDDAQATGSCLVEFFRVHVTSEALCNIDRRRTTNWISNLYGQIMIEKADLCSNSFKDSIIGVAKKLLPGEVCETPAVSQTPDGQVHLVSSLHTLSEAIWDDKFYDPTASAKSPSAPLAPSTQLAVPIRALSTSISTESLRIGNHSPSVPPSTPRGAPPQREANTLSPATISALSIPMRLTSPSQLQAFLSSNKKGENTAQLSSSISKGSLPGLSLASASSFAEKGECKKKSVQGGTTLPVTAPSVASSLASMTVSQASNMASNNESNQEAWVRAVSLCVNTKNGKDNIVELSTSKGRKM